jgi:hypothetical protein
MTQTTDDSMKVFIVTKIHFSYYSYKNFQYLICLSPFRSSHLCRPIKIRNIYKIIIIHTYYLSLCKLPTFVYLFKVDCHI